jgi:hypothetical protein
MREEDLAKEIHHQHTSIKRIVKLKMANAAVIMGSLTSTAKVTFLRGKKNSKFYLLGMVAIC